MLLENHSFTNKQRKKHITKKKKSYQSWEILTEEENRGKNVNYKCDFKVAVGWLLCWQKSTAHEANNE